MTYKVEKKLLTEYIAPIGDYSPEHINLLKRVLRIENHKEVEECLQREKKGYSVEKLQKYDILKAVRYCKTDKTSTELYYLVEDINLNSLTLSDSFKTYAEARQRKEELQGNDIEVFTLDLNQGLEQSENEAEIEGEEKVDLHENEPTDLSYMDGVVEDDWKDKIDLVATQAELLKVIITHCHKENLKGEDADNYIVYTLKAYKEWLLGYATEYAKEGKKYHLENVIQYLGKVRTIYNNLSEKFGTGKKVDDDFKTYYYSEEPTMLREMLNKKSA